MHSFERSGLVVEQCEACRGIFLDLGELERLIDAEGGGWSGRVGPPADVADPLGARPTGRTLAPLPGLPPGADPPGTPGRRTPSQQSHERVAMAPPDGLEPPSGKVTDTLAWYAVR